MRMANPAFIPRNHLVQAVIDAAVQRRISNLLRSCWTLCPAHTRIGQDWSDTPRLRVQRMCPADFLRDVRV